MWPQIAVVTTPHSSGLFCYTFPAVYIFVLCIQSSVTIYDLTGSRPGEAQDATCVGVYRTGRLYRLNQ